MTSRVEAGTERHALQLGEAVTRGHRFPWRPIDGSAVGVRAAGVGVGDGAVAECVWARLWVQRHSFLSFFFFFARLFLRLPCDLEGRPVGQRHAGMSDRVTARARTLLQTTIRKGSDAARHLLSRRDRVQAARPARLFSAPRAPARRRPQPLPHPS